MDINASRLEHLQTEAFKGGCSINVLNTANFAGEILGTETEVMVGYSIPVQIGESEDNLVDVKTSILRSSDPGSAWTEIGVKIEAIDSIFPIVKLLDRSAEGECSIAVFEPTSPASLDFVDLVTTTVDDENAPHLMKEDGTLQYTSEAVETFYRYLNNPGDETARQELVTIFRISDFARIISSTIPLEDPAPDMGIELYTDKKEYLLSRLIKRLGALGIAESVELQARNGEVETNKTQGIASRYTIKTSLTKITEQTGRIDWNIQFGTKEKPIGSRQPWLGAVEFSASGDGEPFTRVVDESVETDRFSHDIIESAKGLTDEHLQSLDSLAIEAGYREITVLPKPEHIRAERVRIIRGPGDYSHDFEIAKQELANYILMCAKNGQPGLLTLAVQHFRTKFVERLDLLDLGTIEMSEPTENGGVLTQARNIKACIDAPGYSVLESATGCVGVVVIRGKSVFEKASNIQHSKVSGSTSAFSLATAITNCTAEDSNSGFYQASKVKDCTVINANQAFIVPSESNIKAFRATTEFPYIMENCTAINCKVAFTHDNKLNISLRERRRFKNIRWASKPGMITKKPHRIINPSRGRR